jgi:DNA-damage-inducible protein D
MNGDPRKEEIAFAQAYFAVRTRESEVIEERMEAISRIAAREGLTEAEKLFSANMFEHGVSSAGIARVRSSGDEALFGGITTSGMKKRLGVPYKKPLADHLPRVTIAAKQLATELTNFNIEEQDMHGEAPITVEHVLNNSDVRELLGRRGVIPENLPAEEDVKKLERKVKSDERRLEQDDGFQPA